MTPTGDLPRGETSRREARRTAVVLLYQWDLGGRPLGALFEGDVDPYAEELANDVLAQVDELDTRLTEASVGWPAERLGAWERNVLRTAVLELDRRDVPTEVVIDEAVRLAKRYASDDAGRLVNGILGRIVREAA